MSAASTGAAKTTGIKADDPEVGQCGTTDRDRPALLEIPMAKGQKRSNREFKKPKKTAAERAKTAATVPVIGSLGKNAKDGQTRR
jgi:hypothetical protein